MNKQLTLRYLQNYEAEQPSAKWSDAAMEIQPHMFRNQRSYQMLREDLERSHCNSSLTLFSYLTIRDRWRLSLSPVLLKVSQLLTFFFPPSPQLVFSLLGFDCSFMLSVERQWDCLGSCTLCPVLPSVQTAFRNIHMN